jgi:hypothetical protein
MRRGCRRRTGRTLSNRTMRPPVKTTRRGNTHGTEEREVLYVFHPWAGCIVHIHEVIKKPTGDVVRCSRDGDATGRCAEIPTWMFERSACATIRVETHPCVHIAALSSLMALISPTVSDVSIIFFELIEAWRSMGIGRAKRQGASQSHVVASQSSPARGARCG